MKDKTLEFLSKNAEGIYVNANDFFQYACADLFLIDTQDLAWVIPFCEKHKKEGIYAVMSFIAEKLPIIEMQTEPFLLALEELKELKPKVFTER